jgi:hypothetical protein
MKLATLAAGILALSTILARAQQPMVFIDGNGAEQQAARQTNSVNRNDQTIELARQLLKICPEISLTRDDAVAPDYSLLLNRGEEGGFLIKAALSQVMVLDGDRNILYAAKEGTLARAARDGCKTILADWKVKRAKRASAK